MSPPAVAEDKSIPRESVLKALIGPILIALLALYFYHLAGSIDPPPGPEQLGAAFWPRMILILLLAGCALKSGEILKSRGNRSAEESPADPRPEVNTPKLAAMIGMVIAAVYFMDVIGFALANLLFLLLFMRIAGLRRKVSLLLTSGLGTVFLLYLFVKVVYLPLPKGQYFFEDMTIALYRFLRII